MFVSVQTARLGRHMLLLPSGLPETCRMKTAVLFSIPMITSSGVCWRWRSADDATDSTKSFASYYDCLFDAQSNGYDVEAQPKPRSKSAFAVRRAWVK